ncbi:hypothetical protein K2173_010725 [Erythroxylum novogranatense]|uniref:Uncharacterized protein n=1 Tax=Erythroxylum novogranatense TaxID=1862640 RepID=A0AAV8SRW4_9ROSI|nr:hypothetical protein K2173_010725 [Erythroxylum novogranatense]
MDLKNSKDHWAFLEEIEAPMWVDLSLEAKSNYQDADDQWFYNSHQFHQCSSRQLKASFSNSPKESLSSEFDLKGPVSPNLPSSVSKSRGKHYTVKKCRGDGFDATFIKQHPVMGLKGKSRLLNSGPEMEPKLSFVSSKGTSSSITNLISEKGSIRNSKDLKKTYAAAGAYRSSSNIVVDKEGVSLSGIITSEGGQQVEQAKKKVSGQGFGHTTGILSAVRTSLRKSYVTRQASRVQTNINSKKSGDSKSSSGKSSVVSSSNISYPGMSSAFTMVHNQEKTPDNRNIIRMTEAATSKVRYLNAQVKGEACNFRGGGKSITASMSKEAKCKVNSPHVSRVSHARLEEGVYFRGAFISTVAKSYCKDASKSKIQAQSRKPKVLLPHADNKKDYVAGAKNAKEKVKVNRKDRVVGTGKENARGLPVSQKSCSEDMFGGQKRIVPRKNGLGLLGPKGEVGSQSKGKHPARVTHKVYLR